MSRKIKTKVCNYDSRDERNERALRIVSKLKRKVPLKDVLLYDDIDLFILINNSIRSAEFILSRRGIIKNNIPKKLYKEIILRYSNCKETYNSFIKIKNENKKVSILFNHKEIKTKDDLNKLKIESINICRDVSKDVDKKLKLFSNTCKFKISYDDIVEYRDIEKLRYLNSMIKPRGNCFTGRNFNYSREEFLKYINKFYYDSKFNFLYNEYLKTNNKFIKPSIDHINPLSRGGNDNVENLQFISYLENVSKNNMTQEEWEETKKNIQYYF